MGFTVKRFVIIDLDEGMMGDIERRKSKTELIPNKNGFLEEVITRA